MFKKNQLSTVMYELLIVQKLTSISISDAIKSLPNIYSASFDNKDLYMHIYRRCCKLVDQGYLVKHQLEDSHNIWYEVTDKFLQEDFFTVERIEYVDNLEKKDGAPEEGSKQTFQELMKRRNQAIDEESELLDIEKQELKKIQNEHPAYASKISKHLDDVDHQLKVNTARQKALPRILK